MVRHDLPHERHRCSRCFSLRFFFLRRNAGTVGNPPSIATPRPSPCRPTSLGIRARYRRLWNHRHRHFPFRRIMKIRVPPVCRLMAMIRSELPPPRAWRRHHSIRISQIRDERRRGSVVCPRRPWHPPPEAVAGSRGTSKDRSGRDPMLAMRRNLASIPLHENERRRGRGGAEEGR